MLSIEATDFCHTVLTCLDLDFSKRLTPRFLVCPRLGQGAGIQSDVPVAPGLLEEAVLGVHRSVRIHFGIPATGPQGPQAAGMG